ncbi:putative toxin-antitoxin system toxin component, PIN family [Neorhizobium galegae]|uniref:putative toxin-antitoxin system toxin component, PIN family n=1 Tax=Neorhizobium galegae TaxID=399 RepID=UPI001F38B68F|nr:putative toxin-antitoxin system toxin component, PIN family [Neorhizobium galegae]MCQ1571495.1 putative toxin-antitoxin system toxin component, PIN family [Neorhizobium galegae]
MKRVVLDTNVLAAGYRSHNGASFAILQAIGFLQIRPLVTVALFLEYEAVLKRTEHMDAHGMALTDIDRALAGFLTLAEPVDVHYQWRPQLSDAKDEMVLEAAVNGHADALITHNVRDFVQAKKPFGLRILKPGELLKELRT